LAGGITRVCLMPDQRMPLDDPALIERAARLGGEAVAVHPFVAATKGLRGDEIAELGLCKAAGAVAAATGRSALPSALVAYRLSQYAHGHGLPLVVHAEVPSLTEGVVASEGEFATRMGLAAAPAFAEAMAITRDIRLAAATGVHLHIPQVTTAEGLDAVRAGKRRGVRVTCGVTPAHLLLNDISIGTWRTFARLSPPLRSESDRLAVVEGVRDGTIDVIASGHDPRTAEDKRLPFAQAEPGMVGVETLLPLALTLVHDGVIDLAQLLAMLSTVPARLFGLPGGSLAPGTPADLVLFDPDAPWRINADVLRSPAKNTPFDGQPVMGKVIRTISGGRR
jgi:dihydroorotase